MNAFERRRRAIAAVARLSIFATMAGCNATVIVESDETAGIDDETSETTGGETSTETATVQPEATCLDVPASATACCNTLLVQGFTDEHLFAQPSIATAEEKGCCELAVTAQDNWDGLAPLPFDQMIPWNCCSAGLVSGAWTDHPTCAPWGPPMPPRMPPRMPRRSTQQAVLA